MRNNKSVILFVVCSLYITNKTAMCFIKKRKFDYSL